MAKTKLRSVPWRRKPPVRFSTPPGGPLPPDWIDVGLRTPEGELPYSDKDLVETIAEQLHLRVGSLPPQFAQTQYRLECYMCGRATEYLDWIVWWYPGLGFSIKGGVLMFEFRGGRTAKQLQRARIVEIVSTASPNPIAIVKELNKEPIRVLDFVGPTWRKKLESRNPPINTWPEAMKRRVGDMSGLRRYIEKRFSDLRKESKQKTTNTANILLLDRPFEVEVSAEEWAERKRRRDAANFSRVATRDAQRGLR